MKFTLKKKYFWVCLYKFPSQSVERSSSFYRAINLILRQETVIGQMGVVVQFYGCKEKVGSQIR